MLRRLCLAKPYWLHFSFTILDFNSFRAFSVVSRFFFFLLFQTAYDGWMDGAAIGHKRMTDTPFLFLLHISDSAGQHHS